jgi:hypothetical protein
MKNEYVMYSRTCGFSFCKADDIDDAQMIQYNTDFYVLDEVSEFPDEMIRLIRATIEEV